MTARSVALFFIYKGRIADVLLEYTLLSFLSLHAFLFVAYPFMAFSMEKDV